MAEHLINIEAMSKFKCILEICSCEPEARQQKVITQAIFLSSEAK